MTDPRDTAREIAEARARLLEFARGCSEEQWSSCPLGEADPRSVSVIVDHVADAYDYIAGWLRTLVGGATLEVNSDMVDELNAKHASNAPVIDRDEVTGHLQTSGDALIRFIEELAPDDLVIGNRRVERLAEIAARHADGHRSEIEAVFG
jgi:hypothetical protein